MLLRWELHIPPKCWHPQRAHTVSTCKPPILIFKNHENKKIHEVNDYAKQETSKMQMSSVYRLLFHVFFIYLSLHFVSEEGILLKFTGVELRNCIPLQPKKLGLSFLNTSQNQLCMMNIATGIETK
jgi:hypothetical protein